LVGEDDCSISSSDDDDNDDDDDDDDTDNEDDDQVLLEEFHKLMSKPMKLQKRHGDLLCFHEKLIDSYALLEATYEVLLTMVKFSQPHTCTCAPHSIYLSCDNSCCSQAKSSCDEHVLVKTYDNLIASENDELKREVEMLKIKLSRLKGKSHMQPSQDHLNVPTRKVIMQSSLEVKKTYLREDALVAKKKAIRSLTAQKWKRQSKSAKTEWSDFDKKFQNLCTMQQRVQSGT
jgi:hypothetical protein